MIFSRVSPLPPHDVDHERRTQPQLQRSLSATVSTTTDSASNKRVVTSSISRRVVDSCSFRRSTLTLLVGLLLSSLDWPTSTSSTVGVSAFTVETKPHVHSINRIVFGTAALSKVEKPLELLDAAFQKGFRRFDLAHTYGAGESERIFGKWLESRKDDIDRFQLDIITKGGIGDDKYGDPDRPILTRANLHDEIQESLDALHTDFVDLYMFHRDDTRLGVSEFVEWINEAVNSGKIKRWGVSNWSFERFQAAHKYACANGLVPPSANSPQFSLAAPDGEVWPSTYSISGPENSHEIDWYKDRGVELLCWEVLAKGFMAKHELWPEHEVDPSTFDLPVERGSDEWRIQRIQKAYCNPENYRRRNLANELAKLCNCNLAQIAMLYPLTRGQHISVIFGSSKAQHLSDMVVLQHLNIDEEAMILLAGTPPEKQEKRTYAFIPQLIEKGLSGLQKQQKQPSSSLMKRGARAAPVAFSMKQSL